MRRYVLARNKDSVRVYVRPTGDQASGGTGVKNYAQAAALLLDDDVWWLYTFLLGL